MILNLLAGLIIATSGVYDGKGATIDYLQLKGDNITVENYRVRNSGPGTNAVAVWGNRNRLRNLVVEQSGATGVYFFSGTNHVLEDSVIRDPVRRQGFDSWGIANMGAKFVTVQRVLVLGSGYTEGGDAGPGTRLLNNTFMVPEDYRTDCNGNIQRDGPCQCAEFGIAIKAGDVGTASGNIISGYRKADPVCGGSGTPGAGIATAADQNVKTWGWRWTNNVITDSTYGIYIGPNTKDNLIEANRFCRNGTGIQDGFTVNTPIRDNEFYQSPNNIYSSTPAEISGNRQIVNCPK